MKNNCISFCRKRHLRTASNHLLMSLTISDFILLSTCYFIVIQGFSGGKPFLGSIGKSQNECTIETSSSQLGLRPYQLPLRNIIFLAIYHSLAFLLILHCIKKFKKKKPLSVLLSTLLFYTHFGRRQEPSSFFLLLLILGPFSTC